MTVTIPEQLGNMVVFEGTKMPLCELGDCSRYVLDKYAEALQTMGDALLDDPEGRVTWAIKLGNVVVMVPQGPRGHQVSRGTRQAAAATFREFIVNDGDPALLRR